MTRVQLQHLPIYSSGPTAILGPDYFQSKFLSCYFTAHGDFCLMSSWVGFGLVIFSFGPVVPPLIFEPLWEQTLSSTPFLWHHMPLRFHSHNKCMLNIFYVPACSRHLGYIRIKQLNGILDSCEGKRQWVRTWRICSWMWCILKRDLGKYTLWRNFEWGQGWGDLVMMVNNQWAGHRAGAGIIPSPAVRSTCKGVQKNMQT
jgi:hypothetical protein